MSQQVVGFTSEYFDALDGEKIYLQTWPGSQPTLKGVIQVAHGMGETADYYTEFSQEANKAGFAVYILEARGHGRTAGDVALPEYKEKAGDIGVNGFQKMRDDQFVLTQRIKAAHPGIPVFLLAHSMGSVVARLYVQSYGSDISGLILTGASSASAGTDELLKIIEREIEANGWKATAKDAFEAIFRNLNMQFEPVKTQLDWITSDQSMIEASLKLPYTYILFNNQFYYFSFLAQKEIAKAENLDKIPKSLPVFLLSGDKDIITDNGTVTRTQYEQFKQVGLTDVQYKLYKDQRHSILREVNRCEVFSDIFEWLESHIQK
ncbi:MAG: lysophospholipase [Chloroflexi bacterium]|jgi:alpha-beta hydrolase superfamily lysophospholipase|nr:lysophospholipase [Chloroflexota bacterium]